MTVKTLAGVRNLKDPSFPIVCRELYKKHSHGVVWAKAVFALAGFRGEYFYKAVETFDIPLCKGLSDEALDAVISTAIIEAGRAKETKAGYEYHHPDFEKFTVRHGGIVGGMIAIQHKKKGWFLFENNDRQQPAIMKSAVEKNTFIVVDFKGESKYLKGSDFVGFWSNIAEDPREVSNFL